MRKKKIGIDNDTIINDTIVADNLLNKIDSLNIKLYKLDSIFNNLKNKLK
jgi:hypothetical protein